MRSAILFLFSFLIIACSKPGPGGKAQLNVHVKEEGTGKVVANGVVYIRYGATEFPGADPGLYDANQLTDINGKTVFEGLRRGSYYLWAVAVDTASGTQTTGGIAFDIRNKTGERDLVIETKP
jgi:hypothetical protein